MSTEMFSFRFRCRVPCVLALLGLASLLLACEQPTPEERLESLRSAYSAELRGFVVEEMPEAEASEGEGAEEEGEAEEGEGETQEGEGETQEGEEESEEGMVATTSNIVFDILVTTQSREKLDGLTLDVYHADENEEQKDHRRIWIDVSGVDRGPGTQITYVLEDVEYEKGDRFFVEVRSPVPPEEREHYREFSEL